MPVGLPDRRALDEITRSGHALTREMHVHGTEYLVRTAPGERGATVQAVLDLTTQHRQRADLLRIMVGLTVAGLLLSVLVGTALAHRAVRPLLDAMSLQRRFVADASHELRTPLTLLSTRAQLLRRSLTAADPQVVRDADGVVRDVARLTDVIDDLLLAAQPTPAAARTRFDVAELCGELVESASDHAERSGVQLVLDTPDEHPMVVASRTGTRRALLALVDNAISHTPRGGAVRLIVGHERDHVVVDVRDTGPGIAEDEGPHVFDRFRSGAQKADRRSYGLGLALAREVITRDGGSLALQPGTTVGATFRVRLPLAR